MKSTASRTENRLAIREGERELRRQSIRAADELRRTRLRAGLSQAGVAAAVGTSRSLICRLEQGHPGVALQTRFRLAALPGADLRLTAYEGSGAMIRDAVQAAVLEWLLEVRDRRWRPTIEASVPGPSRGSIDLVLDGPTDTVLFEIETRLDSLEELSASFTPSDAY